MRLSVFKLRISVGFERTRTCVSRGSGMEKKFLSLFRTADNAGIVHSGDAKSVYQTEWLMADFKKELEVDVEV